MSNIPLQDEPLGLNPLFKITVYLYKQNLTLSPNTVFKLWPFTFVCSILILLQRWWNESRLNQHVLGYMRSAPLHVHKGAQRHNNRRGRGAQIMFCWGCPSSITMQVTASSACESTYMPLRVRAQLGLDIGANKTERGTAWGC